MQVGVLGSGNVARSLAKGFAAEGHSVRIGTRHPDGEGLQEFAGAKVPNISVGLPAEAVRHGKVVVLALLGKVAESSVAEVGASAFAGKVVLDPTNPLEFDANGAPKLFVGFSDSLGERIQRALPAAHVVKAFNTVGHTLMHRPKLPGGPPDMFYCGNDTEAKRTVEGIITSFGWTPLDLGGIEGARLLEPLCIVWVSSAMKLGTWDLAYKFLRA
jgi:8-hydroxy-5-deazaflavin:NADPH oxidoreductase